MTPEIPDENSREEKISAWIDSNLTPEADSQFTEDLGRNPLLRQEARETKAAWDLLDHLPRPQNNPMLTQRTMVLLQLGDTTTQKAPTHPAGETAFVSTFIPMVAWWSFLALVFGLSFWCAKSVIAPVGHAGSGTSRFHWLNAATVPPEYRGDTDFLQWLTAPERFGAASP